MIGLTELIIVALFILVALLWWFWPKDDRPDLTAPPKDLQPRQNILVGTDLHDTDDRPEADPLMEQARAALRRGRKIEAIKLVRQAKNIGLAEAKELVERMAQRNP